MTLVSFLQHQARKRPKGPSRGKEILLAANITKTQNCDFFRTILIERHHRVPEVPKELTIRLKKRFFYNENNLKTTAANL